MEYNRDKGQEVIDCFNAERLLHVGIVLFAGLAIIFYL